MGSRRFCTVQRVQPTWQLTESKAAGIVPVRARTAYACLCSLACAHNHTQQLLQRAAGQLLLAERGRVGVR